DHRDLHSFPTRRSSDLILDLLLPPSASRAGFGPDPEQTVTSSNTREKMRRMLQNGKLDDREVELKEMFSNIMPKKTKKRRLKVTEALELLEQEEADKLVDMETVVRDAVRRA